MNINFIIIFPFFEIVYFIILKEKFQFFIQSVVHFKLRIFITNTNSASRLNVLFKKYSGFSENIMRLTQTRFLFLYRFSLLYI